MKSLSVSVCVCVLALDLKDYSFLLFIQTYNGLKAKKNIQRLKNVKSIVVDNCQL